MKELTMKTHEHYGLSYTDHGLHCSIPCHVDRFYHASIFQYQLMMVHSFSFDIKSVIASVIS